MNNAAKQGAKVSEIPKQANNNDQDGPEISLDKGLCTTCDNGDTCVFPRTNIVVLQCDELDYPPSASSCGSADRKLRLSVAIPRESALETASECEGRLGLCTTCEIRTKCVFPKPESGVWNCDEFV